MNYATCAGHFCFQGRAEGYFKKHCNGAIVLSELRLIDIQLRSHVKERKKILLSFIRISSSA